MKKPQVWIGLLAALGTAIGVMVAVIGLPYGRANYTAFAELYHGPTNTAGVWHMAIDCIPGGVTDDNCNVTLPTASTSVDVTIANSTGVATKLGAFNFTLVNPDILRLVPVVPGSCDPSGLNCNPDFDQATITGSFSCAPPPPNPNDGSVIGGSGSSLSCFDGSADGPIIPGDATHYRGGAVSFTVLANPGSVALSLKDVNVTDDTFSETMSCNPVVTTAGLCFGATINILPEPPATATETSTPTETPTETPTATPTFTPIPDPAIQKVPDSANLWLCTTCGTGPGEGHLHVVEQAMNISDLGAYEFQVEYDKDVIASVNPCDLIFSAAPPANGAGYAARGPVDQVDSSLPENADCNPDPGTSNGTCTMSLILENVVRFGCVTLGQNAGPTDVGPVDLASLDLQPQEDLINDIFPGNNNGVVTIIKDNGCELVDTLGHAVPGSINGGLAPICGDLVVTVRILEGDVTLDCSVDVDDEQEIALHYGSFFGSLLYSKWLDLEPALHDLDIDIKDVQKVFGRDGSSCQSPIPAQPPASFPF